MRLTRWQLRIYAPKRSSAFVHSAECRPFSQVTSESPQFTNVDNSIDVADRIGELYVVDSYYAYVDLRSCCGRCELKYYPLVHKLMPVRFTWPEIKTEPQAWRSSAKPNHLVQHSSCHAKAIFATYISEIVEGPEHVWICKSTSARSRRSAQSRTALTDSSETVL